jgi:hypothetical protein
MYIFINKNNFTKHNNKVRLIMHANMMFDDLAIATLQSKIINDLSCIQYKINYVYRL